MKQILIVEDEVIFYKNLKDVLKKEGFLVDKMADSVDNALALIRQNKPDLVLLDIQLKGDKTGIDLAKLLYDELDIPFIFVTQSEDDITFERASDLKPEHYMVKTKPFLDKKALIRTVKLAFKRHELKLSLYKKGVFGLVDYLEDIRKGGQSDITRVPVNFEKIAFFTKEAWVDSDGYKSGLVDNYSWFLTQDNRKFLIKLSLTDLINNLPDYFVRINSRYVININPEVFDGRINGKKVSILGNEIEISKTYKERFNNKMNQYYLQSKK